MTRHYLNEDSTSVNPLDLVERVVAMHQWCCDRHNDEEIAVFAPGQWCDHNLHFTWSRDINALQFSCAFDMRIPAARRRAVNDLLALVNEQLWLGHFGVWSDDGLPVYRHSYLLGSPGGASIGQIEDVIEIAISECERFYPAFQYVVWAGKSAKDAIEAAMIETLGEA